MPFFLLFPIIGTENAGIRRPVCSRDQPRILRRDSQTGPKNGCRKENVLWAEEEDLTAEAGIQEHGLSEGVPAEGSAEAAEAAPADPVSEGRGSAGRALAAPVSEDRRREGRGSADRDSEAPRRAVPAGGGAARCFPAEDIAPAVREEAEADAFPPSLSSFSSCSCSGFSFRSSPPGTAPK